MGERGAFTPPSEIAGIALEGEVPTLTARVGLRAESGHAIRRRGTFRATDGEWDVYDVPYSDTEALRDEVLALGGAARVVEPDSLAQAVREHAEAALGVARG